MRQNPHTRTVRRQLLDNTALPKCRAARSRRRDRAFGALHLLLQQPSSHASHRCHCAASWPDEMFWLMSPRP
jgi:hypothetical protein